MVTNNRENTGFFSPPLSLFSASPWVEHCIADITGERIRKDFNAKGGTKSRFHLSCY